VSSLSIQINEKLILEIADRSTISGSSQREPSRRKGGGLLKGPFSVVKTLATEDVSKIHPVRVF
jgi:hypothetical protein